MARHKDETPDNKGKLLVLLERWSRAMFGQEDTYKHVGWGDVGMGHC